MGQEQRCPEYYEEKNERNLFYIICKNDAKGSSGPIREGSCLGKKAHGVWEWGRGKHAKPPCLRPAALKQSLRRLLTQ